MEQGTLSVKDAKLNMWLTGRLVERSPEWKPGIGPDAVEKIAATTDLCKTMNELLHLDIYDAERIMERAKEGSNLEKAAQDKLDTANFMLDATAYLAAGKANGRIIFRMAAERYERDLEDASNRIADSRHEVKRERISVQERQRRKKAAAQAKRVESHFNQGGKQRVKVRPGETLPGLFDRPASSVDPQAKNRRPTPVL